MSSEERFCLLEVEAVERRLTEDLCKRVVGGLAALGTLGVEVAVFGRHLFSSTQEGVMLDVACRAADRVSAAVLWRVRVAVSAALGGVEQQPVEALRVERVGAAEFRERLAALSRLAVCASFFRAVGTAGEGLGLPA